MVLVHLARVVVGAVVATLAAEPEELAVLPEVDPSRSARVARQRVAPDDDVVAGLEIGLAQGEDLEPQSGEGLAVEPLDLADSALGHDLLEVRALHRSVGE